MDPRYWQVESSGEREQFRRRNSIGRATLTLVDDSGTAQVLQFEGYKSEVRDGMQRIGEFGFASVPLVGASAVTLHQGGDRGFNSAVGIEDARYRPKGLRPGESGLYGVNGADAQGKGGSMWWALQALAGQVARLWGKTINVGDSNTVTINCTGQAINITGQTGDITVNGVSLVNHVHTGVTPGSGTSGPPQH